MLSGSASHGAGLAVALAAVAALVASSLASGPAAASGQAATEIHRVPQAQAADGDIWFPAGAEDDRPRGEVHVGLEETGACQGGFAVEDVVPDHHGRQCTHGPDPAPAGVDVRERPTTSELMAAAAGATDGTAAAGGAVPCYGDGTTGRRVQVIYAVAADKSDRFASVADLIRTYAYNADETFRQSAARDGGVRHLRWVTDSACRLVVDHVVLSATGDDTIGNTRTELAALGYTRTDRKYLVFADATVYCGIAYTVRDDRPDAINAANNGPTVARVDSGCWGGTASVAAHEIAHTLGAVQLTSPHSNGTWHCTDEWDRLCYADGNSSLPMTYPCASGEALLDCNGDDYYSIAPAAGSWLSTHWNLANSAFLEAAEPVMPTATASPTPTVTASPTPTVTASPTPTVTASPTPTVTASPTPTQSQRKPRKPRISTAFSSRLTEDRQTRTFVVTAGAGPLTTSLRSRHDRRLKVVVRATSGERLLSRHGRLLLIGSTMVPSGKYRISVTGEAGVRFTLRVYRAAR